MRFLLCLAILLFPAVALAQEAPLKSGAALEDIHPDARYDYMAGPQFKALVQTALTQPPEFNFSRFRLAYTMTEQYDPVSERTQRKLLKLSQEALETKDRQALAAYTNLVRDHLASIDVVAMALAMAEENKIFGDPEFFKWVYRGLLASVLKSGNGDSINGAYDALTLGEETVLLGALGLKVLAGNSTHAGIIYYNAYETEDIKTGARRLVYVDVSRPMKYLEWEKERRTTAVSIPKR